MTFSPRVSRHWLLDKRRLEEGSFCASFHIPVTRRRLTRDFEGVGVTISILLVFNCNLHPELFPSSRQLPAESGCSSVPWPQRPLRPGSEPHWASSAGDPLGVGRRRVDVKLVHSSRSRKRSPAGSWLLKVLFGWVAGSGDLRSWRTEREKGIIISFD